MNIVLLFVPLFAMITLLARPGYISTHPISRRPMDHVQSILLQRQIAGLLMVASILVLLMHVPNWAGLTSRAMLAIAIIVPVVPLLAYLISKSVRNPSAAKPYAGMRGGFLFWANYLIVTTVYMTAYEILLRGIFLFFLIERIGIIYAVTINALVYAAMHVMKDPKEALLSVPLGILLCWMTLYTQSVWPSVAFHCLMAISFEYLYSRR